MVCLHEARSCHSGGRWVGRGSYFHKTPYNAQSTRPITLRNGWQINEVRLEDESDADSRAIRVTLSHPQNIEGWQCAGEVETDIDLAFIQCMTASPRKIGSIELPARLYVAKQGENLYQLSDGASLYMTYKNGKLKKGWE